MMAPLLAAAGRDGCVGGCVVVVVLPISIDIRWIERQVLTRLVNSPCVERIFHHIRYWLDQSENKPRSSFFFSSIWRAIHPGATSSWMYMYDELMLLLLLGRSCGLFINLSIVLVAGAAAAPFVAIIFPDLLWGSHPAQDPFIIIFFFLSFSLLFHSSPGVFNFSVWSPLLYSCCCCCHCCCCPYVLLSIVEKNLTYVATTNIW